MVIPSAPDSIRRRVNSSKSGMFFPRALRRVAILFTLTLNLIFFINSLYRLLRMVSNGENRISFWNFSAEGLVLYQSGLIPAPHLREDRLRRDMVLSLCRHSCMCSLIRLLFLYRSGLIFLYSSPPTKAGAQLFNRKIMSSRRRGSNRIGILQ